jgi:hypothetical protein
VKKLTNKLDSKWGVTLAICLTIVVSSAATATAGSLINGKNIKKGTVASKQIKNGTIVKADLSKKLSVAGPQGPQGLQGVAGAAAATKVVTHKTVESAANNTSADTDVQCDAGEHLVGGGAGWAELDGDNELTGAVSISVPSDASGKAAADGSTPTGWTAAGKNLTGASKDFYVYAVCAKP